MAGVTTADIQNYLSSNPGMTDAQIASAMNQYGVSTSQMANATGLSLGEVQSRYDATQQAAPTFNEDIYLQNKLYQLMSDPTAGAHAASIGFTGTTPEALKTFLGSVGFTPEQHYYQHGISEGISALAPRAQLPTFNQEAYLQNKLEQLQSDTAAGDYAKSIGFTGTTTQDLNAFLESVGLTPEEHYYKYGISEGIAPFEFDEDIYLENKLQQILSSPEAQAQATAAGFKGDESDELDQFLTSINLNPVSHYLRYGAAEGVSPTEFQRTPEAYEKRFNELLASTFGTEFNEQQYLQNKLQQLQSNEAAGQQARDLGFVGSTPEELKAFMETFGFTPEKHYREYGQAEGISPGDPLISSSVKNTLYNSYVSQVRQAAREQMPDATDEQREAAVQRYLTAQGETPDTIFDKSFNKERYATKTFDEIETILEASGANKAQEAENLAKISKMFLGYTDEQATELFQKAISGGDLSDGERKVFAELLDTGTVGENTYKDILTHAAVTNPDAPIFKQNPDLLTFYKPLPGIVEKTSNTKWGGGSGQYGFYNGAPILNAQVAENIVGEHGQTTNLNYGQNYSDIAKTLGMDFASHAETTAWKAGRSIVGVDFDKKYLDDLARIDQGLADGTIVRNIDPETGAVSYLQKVEFPAGSFIGGEEYYNYSYQPISAPTLPESSRASGFSVGPATLQEAQDKLSNAAKTLGISTEGKDIDQLFDEITNKTTGMYQIIGNSDAIDRQKYPDAKNHINAVYKQVNDKLIPVDVNFFHADAPKKKKFLGIGGTLGDMLTGIASMPFVAEMSLLVPGASPLLYPSIKAVQVAGLTGDIGEGLKAGAKAWVVRQGAQMANAAIGDYLIDAGLTDISTVNTLADVGSNLAVNMGIAALEGESLSDAGIAALVTSALTSGTKGAAKQLNIPAQYQPVVSRILADAILKNDLEKSLTNIAIRSVGNGIKQVAKEMNQERRAA